MKRPIPQPTENAQPNRGREEAVPQSSRAPAGVALAENTAGTLVLLVEDNADHAELIRRAFEDVDGFRIAIGSNLREARALLGAEPPDLLIVDLVLPDGRGIELLDGDQPGAFPVVVMTSHGDEQVAVEAMKAGALDYVVKSESAFAELPRTVERALREHRHIHGRRDAELALQDSEERFRSLIENALDIVTVIDGEGLVQYVSPSLERVLGLAPEAWVGTNLADLVHPDDRTAVLTMIAETFERPGATETLEYRTRHADGNWHVIGSLGASFPNQEGRPRAVVNSRDITQGKLAEEALRESEARHRTLVENVPVGIHEVGRDGRLLTMNRAGLRMFGFDDEQAVRGLHLTELASAADRERVAAFLEVVLDGHGSEFELEVEVAGEHRFLWSGLMPLTDGSGQVIKAIGHTQDVTERRRAEHERETLEQQLRQSQKMESLGQLAAGVAHDFNNLLTVIAGHATLLEMLPESRSAESTEHLAVIRSALERATGLSRQLLAFGRRQVLQADVLELNKVVGGVHGILRRLIGEDVVLSLELDEQQDRVRADPVQLEQVLLNLAVNARDAMPDGGTLAVRTRRHTLGSPATVGGARLGAGNWAALSVTDSGSGITPEVRVKMFEPFFTTKPRGKGTGLGLSTVYGIVKQSGGQIGVDSVIGKGTTISVFLPLVDEATDSNVAPATPTVVGRGTETVLVAEDDPDLLKLVADLLAGLGYNVLLAADGDEAYRLVERHGISFDLLLSDLVMPGKGGKDVALRFRERFPQAAVVLMSGYAGNDGSERDALHAGEHFLPKPFSPGTLVRMVREALDQRAVR